MQLIHQDSHDGLHLLLVLPVALFLVAFLGALLFIVALFEGISGVNAITRRSEENLASNGWISNVMEAEASAASVAGVLAHGVGDARRVVCVLTGHGLKDPDTALDQAGAVLTCDPELGAIERAVLG